MTLDAATPGSALRIGRLNATWLVPRDYPSPALLRARLDRILERDLALACVRIAAPLCQDSDTSVWFIRRLSVNLAADASAETRRTSEAWAGQLVRALGRQLRLGDDSVDALRFPNRAALIAQFLCDLADGVAWSKWYYTWFDGLRFLAANAAMREAICMDPAGEPALLQLTENNRLDRILDVLTEADCRTVLAKFCGGEEEGLAETDHLQNAWQAWEPGNGLEHPHHAALRLCLSVRRQHTAVPASPGLRTAVYSLIALARWIFSARGGELIAALQQGDTARAFAAVNGDDPQSLAALLRCERVLVGQIAKALREERSAASPNVTEVGGEESTTPFGGVFYLLPNLEDLELEPCAAKLPDFQANKTSALVRFLVLLKCLGKTRAPRAFFDPDVREIAGIPADLSVEEVRVWTRSVTREMAAAFQACWAATRVIRSRWLCVRPTLRGRLLLLSGGERDTWLCAARSARELAGFFEGTAAFGQANLFERHQTEAILCEPSLERMLPPSIAGLPVYRWDLSKEWSDEDPDLAPCIQPGHLPGDELAYLNLPTLLRSPRSLDQTFSLVAREVLRSFAWRLPGFARSSCEYLYRNFLDVSARIQREPNCWDVRLTRSPLHIVMAMTGAVQSTFSISRDAVSKLQIRLTTCER